MGNPLIKETVTLNDAIRVLKAAVKKAEELSQPQDIAVVDVTGQVKASYRMDGAHPACVHIALNKAYTALTFQTETKNLQELTRPDGPIFGLSDAHGGRLCIFPGGVPLVRDGQIVGAVGASTGTIEQDQEVATAGAAAF